MFYRIAPASIELTLSISIFNFTSMHMHGALKMIDL